MCRRRRPASGGAPHASNPTDDDLPERTDPDEPAGPGAGETVRLDDGRLVEVTASATLSAGPLPSAEVLARYGQVNPDLVERIVSMAEVQGQHRHELERQAVEADIAQAGGELQERRLGQWLGFTIAVVPGVAARTGERVVSALRPFDACSRRACAGRRIEDVVGGEHHERGQPIGSGRSKLGGGVNLPLAEIKFTGRTCATRTDPTDRGRSGTNMAGWTGATGHSHLTNHDDSNNPRDRNRDTSAVRVRWWRRK